MTMSSTPTAADEHTLAKSGRVLIVEDEFLIRLTLSEVLADEGYTVVEAETADEAVKLLEEGPPIDVLLTDIQLPGQLDGKALARHVRETHPDLPVIFMTGRPDTMEERGPDAKEIYVAKPYLPSEICAAVRRMLGR